MDEKFHVTVTSRDSAEVDDIALSSPLEDKGTRRLIRPKIVNNAQEAAASVQIRLIHQKRHKKNEPWEDAESFSLATLKSGQEVRFDLDATETWRLKEALNQLYAVGQNGVPPQSMDFVAVPAHNIADSLIVKGSPREMLEKLQDQYGEELWCALGELKPDLLETVALNHLNGKRRKAVETFRRALEAGKGTEEQWQKFFFDNLWIFGHGLNFRLVQATEAQHKVDASGFTVLLGIKTPQALLVETELYENTAHKIGPDVLGGIAGLQSACSKWLADGAPQAPKSILIIGDTKQLDTQDKRASFEMFRRNLHNPELLTFDELLARAEFMVESNTRESML